MVMLNKFKKLLKDCFSGGHFRSFTQNLRKLDRNFTTYTISILQIDTS